MAILSTLVKTIEEAARSSEAGALDKACEALIRQLPIEPGAIENSLAISLMKSLRNNRRFGHMREMAQAILDDGCAHPFVSVYYGQALIETGELEPARAILREQLARPDIDSDLKADAYGIFGRAWKDLAVKTRSHRVEVAKHATRSAFEAYRRPFEEDQTRTYQGINMVAMASWDQGLALNKNERSTARDAAYSILSHIENKPKNDLKPWDFATAGEALIALGRIDEATKWFANYVRDERVNSFALAGTVRQLSELWNLDEINKGAELLAPMRAHLLTMPGGSFTLDREQLSEMEQVTQDAYQKVLGATAPVTYTWMQMAFGTARSVALIRKDGRGFGTGFAIRARDLKDSWGDDILVLTNSHVVSAEGGYQAAKPDDVTVSFEVSDDRGHYGIESIIWESPPNEYDAAILKLTNFPADQIIPLRLSANLPLLDEEEPARVYIIGHPDGGELSFSFEDNHLLDYEIAIANNDVDLTPCRIHYRAPTTPGSSGSPVFTRNWRIIGVHHSGSKDMPRLNGKGGFYPANEGIWIQSIRRALRQEQ